MKILITGATGYIGKRLIPILLNKFVALSVPEFILQAMSIILAGSSCWKSSCPNLNSG